MINQNLCFSTLVKQDKYKNLPGVQYNRIKTGDREHVFVQPTILKGVLPTLEEHLLGARKAVKKQMKTEKDKDAYAMLDAKQLAIKISCNSAYGFTGASHGMYPEPDIAESITSTGRRMIEKTRDFILSKYAKSEVLYGDSVAGYMPILVRQGGQINVTTVESLWHTEKNGQSKIDNHVITKELTDIYHDKHYQSPAYLEVWTDEGFQSVQHIMRHKTNKKMYRVSTPCGIVDVTEDHSLLDSHARAIKPNQLKHGQGLLSCRLLSANYAHDDLILDYSVIEEARVAGMLFGTQMEKDQFLFILNSPRCVRESFWEGYMEGHKMIGKPPHSQYLYTIVESSLAALFLYTLASSIDQTLSIQLVQTENNTELFYLHHNATHDNNLTSMTELDCKEEMYVYDFSTTNHHFQAGIGSLIVHNTDSVMIKFDVPADKEGLKQSFDLGRTAASDISKIFGAAITLEMEKVYFPYLLFGKKRYIGLKYEDPEASKCLDTKGVEVIRRDWSALVREIYKRCINKVFYDRDIEGSKKLVHNYCQDMIDSKLDFKWFVMSKELKSGYANPDSQVHVAVVRKMAKRQPGSEPQIGDRVPYVIVRTPKKTKKTSEKSEDPAYVQEKKIALDYEYYIDKQLVKPLGKFFEPFMPDTSVLFADIRRQLHNEYAGIGRGGLMAYFTKPTTNAVPFSNTVPFLDVEDMDTELPTIASISTTPSTDAGAFSTTPSTTSEEKSHTSVIPSTKNIPQSTPPISDMFDDFDDIITSQTQQLGNKRKLPAARKPAQKRTKTNQVKASGNLLDFY